MSQDGTLDLLGRAAEAMLATQDAYERFRLMASALAKLGIDQINYEYFDADPADVTDNHAPAQGRWRDYLDERDLHETEPHVLTRRRGGMLPFRWGRKGAERIDGPSVVTAACDASETGMRSALCIPLAAIGRPDVAVAGITLGSSLPEAELRRITAGLEPQLVALAHIYHNATIGAMTRARLGIADLSAREREVIVGLARGQRQSQIGVDLGISISAVEQYLANAKRKLKARNTAEAVAKAILYQAVSL